MIAFPLPRPDYGGRYANDGTTKNDFKLSCHTLSTK
jgi:hypothetical protein